MSVRTYCRSLKVAIESTGSRVVPGTLLTTTRASPSTELTRVDFRRSTPDDGNAGISVRGFSPGGSTIWGNKSSSNFGHADTMFR